MPTYATPGDYAEYLDPFELPGEPPAGIGAKLRRASALVSDAISGAIYSTDDDDMPTDVRIARACRDAACEQALAWQANGIDPDKGAAGLERVIASKGLDGATVSYQANGAADAATAALAGGRTLTDAALAILDRAGLINSRVITARGNGGDAYTYDRPYDPTTGRFLS